PGDYFTLDVDADSILLVRGDDGTVHGVHNVCRHRGSRLCAEGSGHVHRIVCPYHQWVYARDGALLGCRGMPADLDTGPLGPDRVHVREAAGLLYVSLAPEPPDFEPARQLLGAFARPQGLTRAKVARLIDYDIRANWKLVWENNRECWHC